MTAVTFDFLTYGGEHSPLYELLHQPVKTLELISANVSPEMTTKVTNYLRQVRASIADIDITWIRGLIPYIKDDIKIPKDELVLMWVYIDYIRRLIPALESINKCLILYYNLSTTQSSDYNAILSGYSMSLDLLRGVDFHFTEYFKEEAKNYQK